jgi:hypothetical protein
MACKYFGTLKQFPAMKELNVVIIKVVSYVWSRDSRFKY